MNRILFVDDERAALDGLRHTLAPYRDLWDMAFAVSGPEALALLDRAPFDVVVTDMRMPEMDGTQLLEQVRSRCPSAVRIVLSESSERDVALRAASVAHQFLAKPCDPAQLREIVEHSGGLARQFPDAALRRVVGAIGKLPSLPRTSTMLLEAMDNQTASLDAIGAIVEQDVGMAAKVLQLVNSAFFGLSNRIASVRAAVGYLGLDTLRQLVLSVEVFRTFHPGQSIGRFSIEALHTHSRLTARIAGSLPGSKETSASAVVAALLHDCGKLVLASRLRKEFAQALQTSQMQGEPLFHTEERQFGVSHAEVGGHLLGLWGLPQPIIDGVWRHHHPVADSQPGSGLDIPAIVHISDALACEVAHAWDAPPESHSLLNTEYVAHLGVEQQIPDWREMARETYLQLTEN